jgi:hypothetical protein
MLIGKTFILLFSLLIPLCTSSVPEKIGSFSDAIKLIQDSNRKMIWFSISSDLVQFIINNYKFNPVGCLNKVLKSNCIRFQHFFLSVMAAPSKYYEIPLRVKRVEISSYFIRICYKINVIIPALFSKIFCSKGEVNDTISIIKIYIKIAKRYTEYPGIAASFSEYAKGILQELSSNVEAWKFAIRILPTLSPNGIAIDYEKFFDIFYWILRPNRSTFPKYNEYDLDYSNHQFLFGIVMHRMTVIKDLDLFKFVHPELPFLVGFMLRYTKFGGVENNISSGYHYAYYRQCLEDFFGPKCKFQSLIETLEREEFLVAMAIEELGLDDERSYPTSLLLDSLERIPLLCQSGNYHNILWQLKGFALIREFLETKKLINK